MERETNEDIKKQVEELKELLQTIEVKDKESQEDMAHINKQLNKVLKKFNKNEN
jgi:hypothetical protein|tara:strand:+ start:1266 stop:1427 length:162 start_codon:yes stop_codon:yes gene_type:complete